MPRAYSHWTSHELKRLREAYPRMTAAEIAREFPRHTLRSIQATAYDNGVHQIKRDWMAIIRNHVPKCDLWGAGGLG